MPKTPPTSATPPTVEAFLKTVLRSGVLDRDTLQAVLRTMPLLSLLVLVVFGEAFRRSGEADRLARVRGVASVESAYERT